jgi:carboxylate-amine ligase
MVWVITGAVTPTPATTATAPRLDDPAAWTAAFEPPAPCTVGLEDEVMVLDAETFDLAPRAPELVAAADDPRIRLELPAAQLELVTAPAASVGAAVSELTALRRDADALARDAGLRLAGAGVHPFAAPAGTLNDAPRYAALTAEYGPVARRQLVFGLHVHVCVRGAARSLAVYNALREHLPLVAALAANAPLHEGADSGLASVRPLISGLLPRQGVPPAFDSWEHVAATHRFGRASGAVRDPSSWWWELRLHPAWGTIEARVADAQTGLAETAAVAGLLHALAARLAARHDAGDLPDPAETWRIAENRWSACRHGLHGTMADVRTGAVRPTAELLADLVEELRPAGEELGCTAELRAAALLAGYGPADRLRAVAAERGPDGAAAWLAAGFVAPRDG